MQASQASPHEIHKLMINGMRILLLSPFFYPEPISTGKYNSQLASALVADGHSVDVICSYPIYPHWTPEDISVPELPGTHVIRGGKNNRYSSKAFLRRVVLEGWYAWHVLKNIKKQTKNIDVVINVYPPSLFSIFLPFFSPKHTRFVGIVHDLQGIYAGRSGSLSGKLVQKIIAAVERKGFNLCSKLIFLSEEMRQWAIKNYQLEISNTQVNYPFTTLDEKLIDGSSDLINNIMPKNKKFIVYSGALGEKQNPEGIYHFFESVVKNHSDWKAAIFSQGPVFDALRNKNTNPSIHFYDLVPADELPHLLKRSDVQLVPQSPGTSDGSLPSKLPNIMLAGTRLLCITDENSELGSIVSSYSNGAVSYSWNNDVCLCTFKALINKDKKESESDRRLLHKFKVSSLVESIITT